MSQLHNSESSVKGCEIVPYIPRNNLPKVPKRPFWPYFATTASIEPEKKQEAELHEYICENMRDIVRVRISYFVAQDRKKIRDLILNNLLHFYCTNDLIYFDFVLFFRTISGLEKQQQL